MLPACLSAQWASQGSIAKVNLVSCRLEQEATHAGQLWDDEVLASKVRACQQLQAVQRKAVQRLAELRVRDGVEIDGPTHAIRPLIL